MSLLQRSAELHIADTAGQAADAARMASASAIAEARRQLGCERVAEFVGILLDHKTPTLPLYALEGFARESRYASERRKNILDHMHDRTTYRHIGDGWLAREYANLWGEGPSIEGYFVTNDQRMYTTGELQTDRPARAPEGHMLGRYLLAGVRIQHIEGHPEPDLRPRDRNEQHHFAVMGMPAGEDILARGLTLNGL